MNNNSGRALKLVACYTEHYLAELACHLFIHNQVRYISGRKIIPHHLKDIALLLLEYADAPETVHELVCCETGHCMAETDLQLHVQRAYAENHCIASALRVLTVGYNNRSPNMYIGGTHAADSRACLCLKTIALQGCLLDRSQGQHSSKAAW